MRSRYLLVVMTAFGLGCSSIQPVATIPINVIEGNPIGLALVNGTSVRFVIDTGGFGAVAISTPELHRLTVTPTDTTVVRTDASGQSFESPKFLIDEFKLGGHVFSAVVGYERVSAKDGFTGGVPINVVGRDLLHQFLVVVDYPRGVIELYDPDSPPNDCARPMTKMAKNVDGHFVVAVQLDGQDHRALLDTGATYSFIQSRVAESRGLTVFDGLFEAESAQLGGHSFGKLDLVVLPIDGAPDIDALIGANFFANHSVCFNYKHGYVFIRY